MPYPLNIFIATEQEMLDFGYGLGESCPSGSVIYLEGELGAGKTTLARGILHGLGYTGFVKSPSYTLIETYPVPKGTVVHIDLYRISGPEALHHIGLEDYIKKDSIFFIEWPEKAESSLPSPTLRCQITRVGEGRNIHMISLFKQVPQWLDNLCNRKG